ncbi:MAG TPA: hypothetical protein VJC09_01620 [Candidatus Saccharimonadales bacterium]|nr:hypothetical protein [Candidatus Saccharimonadales bacterium]
MAIKSNYSKRIQIDKANAAVVVVTAISSFIVVFSLVASKALLSQRSYQSRVISKKEQARDQLKENIVTAKKLETSYKTFIDTTENIIGGNPIGQGERDGNNAQIVLDALPSSYDFPAVANSLEKLLTFKDLTIMSISGTDDELSQKSTNKAGSTQPVPIPFDVSVSGQYSSIQELVKIFESSIRPINISNIQLTGSDSKLTVNIKAQIYYQPATSLDITTKVIK